MQQSSRSQLCGVKYQGGGVGGKMCGQPDGCVVAGKNFTVNCAGGMIQTHPRCQPQSLQVKPQLQLTSQTQGYKQVSSPTQTECNAMGDKQKGESRNEESKKQASKCKQTFQVSNIEGIVIHFGTPTTIEVQSQSPSRSKNMSCKPFKISSRPYKQEIPDESENGDDEECNDLGVLVLDKSNCEIICDKNDTLPSGCQSPSVQLQPFSPEQQIPQLSPMAMNALYAAKQQQSCQPENPTTEGSDFNNDQQETSQPLQSSEQLQQQSVVPAEYDCNQSVKQQPCPPQSESEQLLEEAPAENKYNQPIQQEPCRTRLSQQSLALDDCNCFPILQQLSSPQPQTGKLNQSPKTSVYNCPYPAQQQPCSQQASGKLKQRSTSATNDNNQQIQQQPTSPQQQLHSIPVSAECSEDQPLQQLHPAPSQYEELPQKSSTPLEYNSNQQMQQELFPSQLQNSKSQYCTCNKQLQQFGSVQPQNEYLPQQSLAKSGNDCHQTVQHQPCSLQCHSGRLTGNATSTEVACGDQPQPKFCPLQPKCEQLAQISPHSSAYDCNQPICQESMAKSHKYAPPMQQQQPCQSQYQSVQQYPVLG